MEFATAAQLQQWSLLAADALCDQELVSGVAELVHVENVLGAVKARLLAQIELRDLASALGFASTAEWLSRSGHVDPGTARRQVATATSMTILPTAAQQFADGEISPAHADAIAAAIAAIDEACPNLPAAGREEAEARLVATARAGTPRQVRELGRDLLLRLQPDKEVAGADTTRNRLDAVLGRDGRGRLRGDFDVLTLEKLRSALEPLATPQPADDGTPDPRDAAQRRADAFTDVLDAYLSRGESAGLGSARPQLTLLADARDLAGRGRFVHDLDNPDPDQPQPGRGAYAELFDTEWPYHLNWSGSVPRQIAQMLACDCDVTVVLRDPLGVPLDVARTQRLVTKQIRTALAVRDGGCAMPGCGRPVAWTDAHHIVPWSEGGPTSLTNSTLVCRHDHIELHHGGWEVFIGEDGYPWFIPPATIDPQRRPRRSHNRRHLDTHDPNPDNGP